MAYKFPKLLSELDFFEENIDLIAKNYGRRKYVAIHNKEVIDSDSSENRLSERVSSQFRESVLIISIRDYYANSEKWIGSLLEDMAASGWLKKFS